MAWHIKISLLLNITVNRSCNVIHKWVRVKRYISPPRKWNFTCWVNQGVNSNFAEFWHFRRVPTTTHYILRTRGTVTLRTHSCSLSNSVCYFDLCNCIPRIWFPYETYTLVRSLLLKTTLMNLARAIQCSHTMRYTIRSFHH